jgi:TM2 domain-containing membrane protein YozV
VDNNWVRLAILLSVLLLLAFPFAGLAPLTLLLVVGICGWIFRLIETIVNAKEADKNDSVASE